MCLTKTKTWVKAYLDRNPQIMLIIHKGIADHNKIELDTEAIVSLVKF